jgi:hypothetical protein
MIYPTLFPYGIGGPDEARRSTPVSLKQDVKHLFNLGDSRFQEHPSFLFTAFNKLQRRELLLHTSLKVKRVNFASVASQFASVSPEVVQRVSERIASGSSLDVHYETECEEQQVVRFQGESYVCVWKTTYSLVMGRYAMSTSKNSRSSTKVMVGLGTLRFLCFQIARRRVPSKGLVTLMSTAPLTISPPPKSSAALKIIVRYLIPKSLLS